MHVCQQAASRTVSQILHSAVRGFKIAACSHIVQFAVLGINRFCCREDTQVVTQHAKEQWGQGCCKRRCVLRKNPWCSPVWNMAFSHMAACNSLLQCKTADGDRSEMMTYLHAYPHGKRPSRNMAQTLALATAMTILAPSLAIPPASYFLPTMKPVMFCMAALQAIVQAGSAKVRAQQSSEVCIPLVL